MREIKFRAWDKRKKKMVVVWDIGWKGWDYPESSINYVKCEDGDGTYDLLESSVELMQYTGLKDKNGKEIYEGDILSWQTEDGSEIERTEVYWEESEAGFYGSANGWSHVGFYLVIGNIYENPELLKKD